MDADFTLGTISRFRFNYILSFVSVSVGKYFCQGSFGRAHRIFLFSIDYVDGNTAWPNRKNYLRVGIGFVGGRLGIEP